MPRHGGAVTTVAADLAVFLPNYNHGQYIVQALDALLAQSVQPAVIDVVDDASTDGSPETIARYAERNPTVRATFLDRNRGIHHNMGLWLASAEARYLYFAAADDQVLPGLFEQSLALLRAYPAAGICSALCRLMDADGRDLGLFPTPVCLNAPGYLPPTAAARFLMREDSWFNGSSTIFRREALLAAGGFRPELGSFTDGYASRVVALMTGACFIPRALGCWRRADSGLAGQTSSDVDRVRSLAATAAQLMATEHADLFPKGYAQRWRGRWFFGAFRASIGAADPMRRAAARPLIELPRPLAAVLFAPPLLRQAVWLRLLVLVAFLRLRAWDLGPMALRRVHYAVAKPAEVRAEGRQPATAPPPATQLLADQSQHEIVHGCGDSRRES